MEIYFCEECQTRLSDSEFATGEAVRDGDGVYCKPCALKLGIYGRVREEARAREETAVRKPRSRRRWPQPATPRATRSNLVYAACGAGAALVALLVVVLVKKGGRKEPARRPRRPVVRMPVAQVSRPAPGVPVPPPERDRVLPEKIEPSPVPNRPAPPPPSPPPPRPPVPKPPPSLKLQPVDEGWKSIFSGRDLTGWRVAGGEARVEEGAIVATNNADLFYRADWAEFELACEISGGGGRKGQIVLGLGLGQTGMGRGQWRLAIAFHTDGDAHVFAAGKRFWKSGSGKFPIEDWTPVKLDLTSTALRVYSGEKLLGSAGLNTVPVKKGGIYFYSNAGHTARLRNVRVRVISR